MDLTMPRWGDSIEEGTILEWHVAVGDEVAEGEALATIQTDKVDGDLEAPASGTIAELTVDAGTTVPVGAVVARIVAA